MAGYGIQLIQNIHMISGRYTTDTEEYISDKMADTGIQSDTEVGVENLKTVTDVKQTPDAETGANLKTVIDAYMIQGQM